MIANT